MTKEWLKLILSGEKRLLTLTDMKPVHVVGYGMSDALGISPTECFERMLDENDYSREIPGMKKQCEEIFHLAIYRGAMHDESRIVMPEGFDKKMWRSMTNAQKMMSNTTEQAMQMAVGAKRQAAIHDLSVQSLAKLVEESVKEPEAEVVEK